MLLLALSSTLVAQSAQPHLRKLLGISAENGLFAIDGHVLTAFSHGDIFLQYPPSRLGQMVDKTSDSVTIEFEQSQWRRIAKPLPLSSASDFVLCDRLNQIDIDSIDPSVPPALPTGARVKSIVEFDKGPTVVVYSTSSKAVTYDVRVALLQKKTTGGYSLVDDDLASDYGCYCGVQVEGGRLLLVFTNEPAGSSDYVAAYAYAVVPPEPSK
jgi:hypothetical protein